MVIVYLVGVVITWVYVGLSTGRQFYRVSHANPQMPVQVNWGNVFWQCVVWPAFWASFIGSEVEKRVEKRREDSLKRFNWKEDDSSVADPEVFRDAARDMLK